MISCNSLHLKCIIEFKIFLTQLSLCMKTCADFGYKIYGLFTNLSLA
jgi:hypothetical protein